MSLNFIDGCSHYNNTTESTRKGWTHVANTVLIAYSQAGRFSGNSIRLYQPGVFPGTYTMSRLLKYVTATPYFGVAVLSDVVPQAGYYKYFEFRDGTSQQVGVRINDNLTLSLLVGSSVVSTSVKALIVGNWHQITGQFNIHNSSGTAKVYLDGELLIDFAGDTQQTANATASSFYIIHGGNGGSPGSLYFCDLYLGDASGNVNTTPPLDCRITTLFPTSSGTYNGWSYSGTTYAWQAVDDANPDDDTSFIYSSTSGTVSTFVFGDLEADASAVYGTQISHYSRKDDAVTRITRGALYFSGTAKYFGDTQYLGANYAYFTHMLEYEPFASGTLTPDIINAIEPGILVDT